MNKYIQQKQQQQFQQQLQQHQHLCLTAMQGSCMATAMQGSCMAGLAPCKALHGNKAPRKAAYSMPIVLDGLVTVVADQPLGLSGCSSVA